LVNDFDMNNPKNDFKPHPLMRGGILQSIMGAKFTGKTSLPNRKFHSVVVDKNSLLHVYEIPPPKVTSPIVLMSHGMAGCSESEYMRRIAAKLLRKSFGVFMMNQRGSGTGMGMSDRLWNGGSSDDLSAVIDYIVTIYPNRALLLVGFSLSGNILLKYLGEGRKIPTNINAAFSVNPPIDLKTASDILSSGSGGGLFNKDFLKPMNLQIEAMAECFPNTFLPPRKPVSILDFDTIYTTPAGGFKDVDEYYRKSSSKQFLEGIKVPTILLCSQDDPFIPSKVFMDARMSLCIEFLAPEHGGHMGYISSSTTPFGDKRWMDSVIVNWAQDVFPQLMFSQET
jgi:predicted alpha/beta-fold hydrolase